MKSRIREAPLRALALGVAALAVTVGGATAGLEASDDGVINACRHKSGFLLVPSAGKSCKRSEQALNWNVRGRPGPPAPRVAMGRRQGRRAGTRRGPGEPGPGGRPAGRRACRAARGRRDDRGDRGAGRHRLHDEQRDARRGLGRDRGGRRDRAHVRGGGGAAASPARVRRLVINEIDYDQVGADSGGFVEIFNAGDTAADLDGRRRSFSSTAAPAPSTCDVRSRGTLAAGAYLVVAVDAQNGPRRSRADRHRRRRRSWTPSRTKARSRPRRSARRPTTSLKAPSCRSSVADSTTTDGRARAHPQRPRHERRSQRLVLHDHGHAG